MTVNYHNIVVARESRGLTQSELTKAIKGLSQGNLSRMEKGLLPISEEILNAISKKLDYPLSFFSKATIRIPLGTFHYRKRITMGQKKLSILEARLDILSNIIDELLESITINEFDIPHLEVTEKRNAAEIAYKLREFFNVGSAPIENIVKLLEKHGVIVVFFKIDNEKFDGVTRITQKSQPVIFLNSQMPNDRKRFTIAHELGHLVMHLRTSLENEVEDDVKEMQANQFAAEFNLPAIEGRKTLCNLKYQDLGVLKMYWKISKAAILYRAKELGVLGDSQYRYYMMQLSRSGQRKNEIESVSIDRPVILKRMFELHWTELGYSKEELSDLLGISINDLNLLYNSLTNESTKLKIII
jgi:Zn-dependent peptidase ImmA (M78 family)/DNA-binding XRE family transcriptional regulator|nr:MAG TPA: IrrE protein [Caudoviricetes sp.]